MLCKFGFKMPIHDPFGEFLGIKVGVNINSLHFYPLGMQKPVGLTSCESNNIKIGSVVWSQEVSKIWGYRKRTN